MALFRKKKKDKSKAKQDKKKPLLDSSNAIDEILNKHGKKRKKNRKKFNGYQNPGVDEVE